MQSFLCISVSFLRGAENRLRSTALSFLCSFSIFLCSFSIFALQGAGQVFRGSVFGDLADPRLFSAQGQFWVFGDPADPRLFSAQGQFWVFGDPADLRLFSARGSFEKRLGISSEPFFFQNHSDARIISSRPLFPRSPLRRESGGRQPFRRRHRDGGPSYKPACNRRLRSHRKERWC